MPTQEFSLNDLKILSFIQNVILMFILEELVTKYDFNIEGKLLNLVYHIQFQQYLKSII